MWTTADIPFLKDKLTIVTGATGGLGYETALELARAGADVVVAGRSEEKGRRALARVQTQARLANIRFELLDLASLASIERFSTRLLAEDRPLDLLINNAGVMTPPKRKETADGFELQFGTNHLGHFALTGRLLPLLLRSKSARVVTVSSFAHRLGASIHFADLQWTDRYKPSAAYAQSKLANLLFAFELQRLSDAHAWNLTSNAAHPGASLTDLIPNQGMESWDQRLKLRVVRAIGQSAAAGALPTLFAATSPSAKPFGYYGPDGLLEMKGAVAPAVVSRKAKDTALARRLWQVSEQLTGVYWPALDAAPEPSTRRVPAASAQRA